MSNYPQLAEFLRVLPDALLLVDFDGTVVEAHVPEADGLFDVESGLVGRKLSEVLSADFTDKLESSFRVLPTTRFPAVFEFESATNGRRRVHEARLIRCDGRRCLVVFRDVTLRERADALAQQIADMRLELAHAERAILLGRLPATMAHDLSQPMTAIMANAEAATQLLAEPEHDASELSRIQLDIVQSAERATALLDRIRAALRTQRTAPEIMDVNLLVDDVALMARNELMLRRIPLRTQFASDLPRIGGARLQLQQVVLNLVLNAADAVEARAHPSIDLVTARIGPTVAIDVRDNGKGIDAADFPRLCQPFFSTKRKAWAWG